MTTYPKGKGIHGFVSQLVFFEMWALLLAIPLGSPKYIKIASIYHKGRQIFFLLSGLPTINC